MTDKLRNILSVARQYPENLFTIEYRKPCANGCVYCFWKNN